MSWDSYIDNLIGQSRDASGQPACDRACIIGLDGSPWTSGAHPSSWELTQAEGSYLAAALKSGDFSVLQAAGIRAGGVRYQFLRGEDGMVLGKKKGEGAITAQKSRTAVVVGHTVEGRSQGNTNKAVAVIAEYLESLGM